MNDNQKREFIKKPLTIEQQLSLLENRGLIIDNKDMAYKKLAIPY